MDIFESLESTETNELATSLAKAQMEYDIPLFDGFGNFKTPTNPEGNPFCSLTSLTTATRGPLTKYGLSVETKIISEGEFDFHYTILRHSSGQFSASKVRMIPDKPGMHGLASCNTYLSRIGYANAVGAARGEHDNDGGDGIVEKKHVPSTYHQSREYVTHVKNATETLDSYEISDLLTYPEDLQTKFMSFNKVTKLGDLTKAQYANILKYYPKK